MAKLIPVEVVDKKSSNLKLIPVEVVGNNTNLGKESTAGGDTSARQQFISSLLPDRNNTKSIIPMAEAAQKGRQEFVSTLLPDRNNIKSVIPMAEAAKKARVRDLITTGGVNNRVEDAQKAYDEAKELLKHPDYQGKYLPKVSDFLYATDLFADFLKKKKELYNAKKEAALLNGKAYDPREGNDAFATIADTAMLGGEYVGNSIAAGMGMTVKGATATANLAYNIAAGYLLEHFGVKGSIFSSLNDKATDALNDYNNKMNKSAALVGDKYAIGGNIISNVVAMIPSMMTAWAKAGKAVIKGGSYLVNGGGSAILNTVKSYASNPVYWDSFLRTLGTDYEDAKENGASEAQALSFAFLTSSVNAAVEIGGVQELPGELQGAVGSKRRMWEFFKTALDEGKEEGVQRIISDVNSHLVYGNNFMKDKTVKQYGKEVFGDAAMGFAVGAFMSGAQLTIDYSLNAKTESEYKAIGKELTRAGEDKAKAIINYGAKSLDTNVREAAIGLRSGKKDYVALGQLYQYTINDITTYLTTPSDISVVNENFENIIKNNASNLIQDIAVSQYVSKLIDLGNDINTANNTVNEVMGMYDENYTNTLKSDEENDIINNGGESNEISDERRNYGNNGKSQSGQSNTGTKSENGRAWRENESDFIRRTQSDSEEAGHGRRLYVRHGNSVLAYTEKTPDNTRGSIAAQLLNDIGVNSVYCEGDIETNQNGITVRRSEAVTAPDGTVYTSSNSTIPPAETAYHENVHSNDFRGDEAYSEYESVICGNLLYNSLEFEDLCQRINDNHYGGKYDVEAIDDSKKFIREIAAYVNQFVMTDPEYADRTFSEMFDDWQAVVEAVKKFNKDTGADFSESAFSIPDNSVLQSNASDTAGAESSIDNEQNVGYNNKRGESYVRTDEFRDLQAESKGMSDKDIQLYHSGNKSINEELRSHLSGILQSQIRASADGSGNAVRLLKLKGKNTSFNVYENINGELFHDVFEMARNYLKFGELVDLHDVNTTDEGIGYNDCFNYLSEDGLSGFSITPDGDLISVFNASGKPGFLYSIADIVKEKAKTLDCYASEKQNLQQIYQKVFGFKTASIMDYNMEYDHDNIAENHGSPQVAFMVNTNEEVQTKHFTKDQYGEAVEYRDSFVTKATSENGAASFMPENRRLFSEESKLSKAKAQERLISIAQHLDKEMKLVFVKKDSIQLKGKNGKYVRSTNTLFISKDASIADQYIEVFKHEFVHRLESRKSYASFKNYLINNSSAFEKYVRASLKLIYKKEFIGTREEAVNALAKYYYKRYTEDKNIAKYIRKDFTMESAEREIVADFAGDILFKGEKYLKDAAVKLADEVIAEEGDAESSLEALEEIAKTDRNLFQKLLDAIKDLINAIMGRPQTQSITDDLRYIENRLKRVYDSSDTKKAAEKAGDVKYSIASDVNGKFVSIDTNQSIFDDKTIQEMQDIAKRIILDNFKGKVLSVGENEKVYINKRSSEEYAYPANRRIDISSKESKMRAAPELDNLLAVSTFVEHQNDDGRHHQATGGWDIYSTRFKVNDMMFFGKVKIMVTDRGRIFYDITQIKRLPVTGGLTENNSVAASGNLSTDIIADSQPNVNTNYTQESENYSETESEDGQFSIGSPMQQARENRIKYDNGEMTREEYLEENDRLWGEANEKYGSITEGENASNPISVPMQVTDDKNTERFIRTVLESGKLDEDMVTEVEDQLLNGEYSYKPVSDESAMNNAEAAIENGTAAEEWENAVNGTERISKRKIAIGEKLLTEAAKAGDAERVVELSAELADVLTRAGQVVQAARMLKRMTGEGRLVSLQRTVKTLNKDIRSRHGDNSSPIKIDPKSAKRLVNAKTKAGIEEAYQQILQEVADQSPSTWIDKWNAWRYFAMLSNPKTHIRNIVGNAIFLPMVRIKDFIATGLEGAAAGLNIINNSQKTKSVVIKKEYRQFAKNDSKNKDTIALLSGAKKYDDRSQIQQKKKIFKSEVLNFVTSLNGSLLEAEDLLFKNRHYIHALAGFLQARNIDLNNVSEEVMMDARTYAVKEALKATFNDESALANQIQNFSSVKYDTVTKNGKEKKYINGASLLVNAAVEGNLPFKRTPVNIIRRSLEYSPLGLTSTLTKGIYDIKKGKITATEFIDSLAAGLTGTGVMLIGMLLSSLGYVTGAADDDDKSIFEKLLGKQEYAVEFFGKSYTIDFAAPACIPFFIGVEMMETKNGTEDFSLAKLGNVIWNTLEPITNLSMLSGMQSVIEATRYADNSQILASIAADSALNFATQGIPSVLGGVARTIDPKQRTWYTDKGSKTADKFTQQAINSLKSKIPGLSYTQAPKIDEWGNEVSRGSITERIAENFFSPGYYSSEKVDEVSSELIRLHDATKENVFPKKALGSITVSGDVVYLNKDQYVKYAKAKGKYSFDYINEFLEGKDHKKAYKNLTDEEKAYVIKKLYEYANAKAKHDVIPKYDMKQYSSVVDHEKSGDSAIDYYIYKAMEYFKDYR